MQNLLREIRTSFGNATSLYKLMLINVAVFVVIQLFRLVFFLYGGNQEIITDITGFLCLPASLAELLTHPWTIITYMFLHFNFMHIFFNMLILYWTGKLFTEYLGNDKLWATYILGGLAGAVAYLIVFNIFPVFAANVGSAKLLGASAGVIAVMVAIATLLPDYTVHLMFFGPVKLKYIAGFSVLLYIISIPDGNAGGSIAHLGGALWGYISIKQLKKGNDLSSWLTGLVSRFNKPKMRVVTEKKKRGETDEDYKERKKSRQEIIDKILDKISQSGYESLTAEEKDILFKASRNFKE